MSDLKRALALIKEKGLWGLGEMDGCLCCHFAVMGVAVDISCRKSSGAYHHIDPDHYGFVARIVWNIDDAMPEEVAALDAEVVRQIEAQGNELPIVVRHCDWATDDKLKCVYCGKPRQRPMKYLCDACQEGNDLFGQPIARRYECIA